MSEQVINAIKQKYGVSDEVSQQVVSALVEVEKHRQASGMRGAGGQTPDIMSIVGGLLGGGQQGGQGGDLMGMIGGLLGGGGQPQGNQGGDLMGMVSSLLGGGQAQGGHNMASILGDLLGGANHPSQAPDLTSIVGGLLGGQGGDLAGMVNSLLGGGQPTPTNQPTQQPTLNHPTVQQQTNHPAKQPAKPNLGNIGEALGDKINKQTIHREGPEKKSSDRGSMGGQKPGKK